MEKSSRGGKFGKNVESSQYGAAAATRGPAKEVHLT